MYLGVALNLNMSGVTISDSPPGDGVFGNLMLVGVGRMVIPFVWTGLAWEALQGWIL